MKRAIMLILILSLFLVGCVSKEKQLQCEKCPEDSKKALLSCVFYGWGPNPEDSKKSVFQYTLLNYGYEEARNVIVMCKVMYQNKDLIFSAQGNIASIQPVSMMNNDMELDYVSNLFSGTIGTCYIKSCDNCEILDNRIESLKEEIGIK